MEVVSAKEQGRLAVTPVKKTYSISSYEMPVVLFSWSDARGPAGNQGVSFVLEDGSRGDFPADFVLYHCDPTCDWSPITQLKKALKDKLGTSKLSVRVIADALNTSSSQVVRLLQENKASKQLVQLFQLAELAGYQIEFNLKKKKTA